MFQKLKWNPGFLSMVKRLKPTGAKKSRNTLKKRKLQEKVYSDKHSGKELPALNNGDKVALQHGSKWVPATVISKHHPPKSSIVQTPEVQKYQRNHRHLNECQTPKSLPLKPESIATHTPQACPANSFCRITPSKSVETSCAYSFQTTSQGACSP